MPQFVQTEQQQELIRELIQDLPAYRKKLRMSQADLGDAIGKSRQKISELERGAAPLGWDTYLAILMVLGARGVLEPRGRDAERLALTGKLIGGRIRL
jgi:transcriptional regulator with XRE-family HTH domain